MLMFLILNTLVLLVYIWLSTGSRRKSINIHLSRLEESIGKETPVLSETAALKAQIRVFVLYTVDMTDSLPVNMQSAS